MSYNGIDLTRGEYMETRMDRHRVPLLSLKDKLLILFITIIICMSALGYMIIYFGGVFIVDKEELTLDATTTLVTTEGDMVGQLYQENRTLIGLDDIPEYVIDAYIAVEDRRFYQHGGIDYQSIFRAVYRDIMTGSKVEGGSTITQQLAKNLFLTNDKTWLRKTKEVMAAIYLERHYSKDEILELYLNKIYFGSGVYGIETASQKFFSKPAKELTLEEGALLAGLAKAPNGYSPINHPDKSIERRNTVLKVMEKQEKITTDELQEAEAKPLSIEVSKQEERPWVDSYVDLVMKEAAEKYNLTVADLQSGGYRIVVNMDKNAQQAVYTRFQDDNYFPGNTEGVEGAFIMKEPKTGEIKVAIGGRDYHLGELNRLNVNRQPGSTFKPIAVYGPALMTGDYKPYSLLPDRQVDSETYGVKNANQEYDNIVSLYSALVKSKNTSSTWMLDQIGIDYSKEYLEKMGMDIPDDGLAIALGGLDEGVTPFNMVDAYSAFANNGTIVESSTINEIYNSDDQRIDQEDRQTTDVFSSQVAWDMTEMLSYTAKYGTASAGDYAGNLAGKTGTTQHPLVDGENKDAWFVGYTPNMVTAMWMGYDTSDKDHYLTGGSAYPTRLTKDILTELKGNLALGDDFKRPENVQALPDPIQLPVISDVQGKVGLGGNSLMKGELTWTGSDDERVVYRIYKQKSGIDERIGEVEGQNSYTITGLSLLQTNSYYVVPYDPLTKLEGKHSEAVELSF